MTYQIDIPACFASDHFERDLPSGECIKTTKRLWTFVCTFEELEEWLSDADYYSDCAGFGWDMGTEALGMQSSARATVKRVEKLLADIVHTVDGSQATITNLGDAK